MQKNVKSQRQKASSTGERVCGKTRTSGKTVLHKTVASKASKYPRAADAEGFISKRESEDEKIYVIPLTNEARNNERIFPEPVWRNIPENTPLFALKQSLSEQRKTEYSPPFTLSYRLSMKRLSRLIALTVFTMLIPAPFVYADPSSGLEDRLIRTVIFSRHGVRSPTQSPATLKQWASKPWPVWPVKPGELTLRGKALIRAQWTALKPVLEKHGLLSENSCPAPQQYSLIADEDQRTRETAVAIFEGLAPGCRINPQYGTRYDTLFHPDMTSWREMNHQEALDQVQSRLDLLEKDPGVQSALNRLQEITGCCNHLSLLREKEERYTSLKELPTRIRIDSQKPKLDISGKWPIASSIAEIMLLEYGQWPDRNAGWGKVDENILKQIVPLHDRVFDATHRAPLLAKAGGKYLVKNIRDTLLSEQSPRLSILVGHDTDIAYIGGLLGISWTVPEQGLNPIPPGSFMSFELWEKTEGNREIRIYFHAPAFASLHSVPASETMPVKVPVDKPFYRVSDFSQQVDRVTGL